MQLVAREMNLSETAFLCPEQDGYRLRWFTPAVEVDMCGHATLASAHVLWETGHLCVTQTARFHARSGLLTAVRAGDWIDMDFPATPPEPCLLPGAISMALGCKVLEGSRSCFDYLVEVENETVVRGLVPDFELLSKVDTRGVIVTALADAPGFDFVSRFFAPAAGVNEDPVTGSAHACLGPYWAAKLGRRELVAFQASRRGGIVRVSVRGERVMLSGQAVTVLRGELVA